MNGTGARSLKIPNSQNLTKFIQKLTNAERENFQKPGTNRSAWIQKWINTQHRNAFRRYVTALQKSLTNTNKLNMVLKNYPYEVMLQIPNQNRNGNVKGYIALTPVCENNRNRGVFIAHGATFEGYRGEHIGTRLRKAAVNAARNAKVRLYQVSRNLAGLVPEGALPISGRIMSSLGANRMLTPPPCQQVNTKGPKSFFFMFNGTAKKALPRRANYRKPPPRTVNRKKWSQRALPPPPVRRGPQPQKPRWRR